MSLTANVRGALLAALLIGMPCTALAQSLPAPGSPPPRPRLLFTASEVNGLQTRVNGGGVPGWAFSQLSSGASFQTASNQASWQVYRSMRFMLEAAVRWKLTGNTSAKSSALSLLIRGWPNAIGYLNPTGSNKIYVEATYIGAIAIAFDLLHGDLTTSERATIVTELQSWVSSMYVGTAGPGSYNQYGGATDNHSFAWNTGIVMGLLAIWGEPGVNGTAVVNQVDAALAKIADGYSDVVSPDGSYDENSGYNTYGSMYSLRAHKIAQKCGFHDYVSGTNINFMPRWYGRLLMGDSFHWTGDSSPTHRGVEFDPILYWLVDREQDDEGLWCLERVRAFQNIDINTSTWAFSPFLSAFLHFPDTLTPATPEVMSGFFRDNKNIAPGGWAGWNKLNNNSEVGLGGSAWLHNTSDPSWNAFGLHYIIRDEWMSHSHEDDGHIDIVSDGGHLILDRGYATPGSWAHAQSVDHNIVTVNGQGFSGNGTNPFQPPGPAGRFYGTLRGRLLSPQLDYVRGDHGFMWMMERADRSVVLVKDPVAPFAIVLDQVRKSTGTHTYEQRWNTAAAMNGTGTASNPVTISTGGKTVRGTWLAPQSVSVVTGGQSVNAGTTYRSNRVLATGTSDTTILGLWYPGTLQTTTPLVNASPNTEGGVVVWDSNRVDKILTSIDQNPAADFETFVEGRMAWLRRDQSGVVQAHAVAEATRLDNGTTTLVDASEPITAVVKGGEVWIARDLAADPAITPFITVWSPSAVTRVVVDGADVPFSQVGDVVSVGTPPPPPPPPPPPLTRDRFYTFTDGEHLDGQVIGDPRFEQGGVFSNSGFLRFEPSGSDPYPAQPLWVGLDVECRGLFMGFIGSVQFSSISGQGDVLTIDLYDGPAGGVYAVASHFLAPPSIALIPRIGPDGPTRCAFLVRPTIGTIAFCDRIGRTVGFGTMPAWTEDIRVTIKMAPDVFYDNISLFDSEEDGIDPQGAAVWLTSNGRFGMAFQAPQVLFGNATLSAAGITLPPSIFNLWATQFGMSEIVLLPHSPNGLAAPLQARELAFETIASGAVPLDPGIPYVISGVTAAGVNFTAGAWFQP